MTGFTTWLATASWWELLLWYTVLFIITSATNLGPSVKGIESRLDRIADALERLEKRR